MVVGLFIVIVKLQNSNSKAANITHFVGRHCLQLYNKLNEEMVTALSLFNQRLYHFLRHQQIALVVQVNAI